MIVVVEKIRYETHIFKMRKKTAKKLIFRIFIHELEEVIYEAVIVRYAFIKYSINKPKIIKKELTYWEGTP